MAHQPAMPPTTKKPQLPRRAIQQIDADMEELEERQDTMQGAAVDAVSWPTLSRATVQVRQD